MGIFDLLFGNKDEKNHFEIEIFSTEFEYISKCVLEYQNLETGGDLFGRWIDSSKSSIDYVLGPGPNVKRTSTSFYQDRNFLVSGGNTLINNYGLYHVGEWHSHHKLGLREPSSGDVNTIKLAFENPKYKLNKFLLIICTIEENGVALNPYIFYKESEESTKIALAKCDLKVRKDTNSLRNDFDKNYSGFLYIPQNWQGEEEESIKNEEKQNTENIINFPKDSWLNKKNGKNYLQSICLNLNKNSDGLKIFPNQEGSVYIEIYIENQIFIINFPVDFPKNRPIVTLKENEVNETFYEINNTLHWNKNSKPEEYILQCIEMFLKSTKINIEIK